MEKRKHLQTALAYVQQGKLDQAIAEYQAILRADPNNCNVLNALGDLLARTGNRIEAIANFMRLGEVYRVDGLSVRAIAVYKKVLKIDPLHTEASLACAEMYAEQGLFAEAKLQFEGLANYYLRRGDLAEVLDVYEKVLRMDPGNRLTLSKIAGILVRPGRTEGALARLTALEEHLVGAGQGEDARYIYERAVELLKSQGRDTDAAFFTDRLHSLDPAVAEARVDEVLQTAFPGEGSPGEPTETAVEATPLEILPGSTVEQDEPPSLEEEVPVVEQERPALEQETPAIELPDEVGGWLEAEPGVVVSLPDDRLAGEEPAVEAEKGVGPEEIVEVDLSMVGGVESGEETEPATIELDASEGSEALITLGEESSEPGGLIETQTSEEELQEAQFYLEQGMFQEAQAILQRILVRDPAHPLAKQHLAEIERSVGRPKKEEVLPPDIKKPSIFHVAEVKGSEGEYVDLAGELSEELSEEGTRTPPDLEPEVQGMLYQLEQGIRDQLDVTDYETHYNLGIAYKDLELHDKAIEELRLAANDATYRVRCASLMGVCYLAKGKPERAVEELLKGLATTEAGTDERWGILYDLATAYEALGNVKKALESLLAIHSETPRFRDIRVRVRDLRERLGPGRESSQRG
ncbi:MAG: tetratricopeptide repeat protein [Candidatus Methylomirabilales bacterium]